MEEDFLEDLSTEGLGDRKVDIERRISPSDKDNTASDGTGSRGVIIKEKPDDDNIPTYSVDMPQSFVDDVLSSYKSFIANTQDKRDKPICDTFKRLFSKEVNRSKPAWLCDKLLFASRLVGRIFCGNVTATCFLVSEDIVMTNAHVYRKIKIEMDRSGLPNEHKNAAVRFHHIYPNQREELLEVEVRIDDTIAQSSEDDLDYVLLRLKDHDHQVVRDRAVICNELFKYDATDQQDGLVTIIGHPSGQIKAMDTDCKIIPEHLWRNQVHKRVRENVAVDRYFHLSQKISKDVTSDEYNDKLAYDTSFFEGASGSPVFNDQGRLIAMHTCGYAIDNTSSVMEFGVFMTAIFKDLYWKDRSLATELFPHYPLPMSVEPA